MGYILPDPDCKVNSFYLWKAVKLLLNVSHFQQQQSVIQNTYNALWWKWAVHIYLSSAKPSKWGSSSFFFFFFFSTVTFHIGFGNKWFWVSWITKMFLKSTFFPDSSYSPYIYITSEKYGRTKRKRRRKRTRFQDRQLSKPFYKKLIHKMLNSSFFNAVRRARISHIIFMRKHTRIHLVLVFFFG